MAPQFYWWKVLLFRTLGKYTCLICTAELTNDIAKIVWAVLWRIKHMYYGLTSIKVDKSTMSNSCLFRVTTQFIQSFNICDHSTFWNVLVKYTHLWSPSSIIYRAITIQKDLSTLEQLAVLYYSTGRPRDSLTLYNEIDFLTATYEPESVIRYVCYILCHLSLHKWQ